MAAHSIIFRSTLFPDKDISINQLIEKIREDLTEYEYFGEMIDNPFDFQHDEQYNAFINGHCFISLDFDTKEDIDYKNTDAKEYFIDLLQKNKVRLISDGKNIEIFQD